jgi:hypothetical protein
VKCNERASSMSISPALAAGFTHVARRSLIAVVPDAGNTLERLKLNDPTFAPDGVLDRPERSDDDREVLFHYPGDIVLGA